MPSVISSILGALQTPSGSFTTKLPFTLAQARGMLEEAIAAEQAQVGIFLQQKSRLLSIGTRASALSKVPNSSSYSVVLLARQKALMDQNAELEKDSLRFVREANELYNTLQTSPEWRNLAGANMAVLGWAALNRVKMMIETAANVVKNLGDTRKRIKAHISAVNDLEGELNDAEGIAAGVGIRGTAQALVGGYRDLFKSPLMILAGAAGVALILMYAPRKK